MTLSREPSFQIDRAEMISVGTELLIGQITDTNAAYLAGQMAELGIAVYRQTVVGDNARRLEDAIRKALADNDLVVTTGGLGPTSDDVTSEVAASVAGVPLVRDQAVMDDLSARYPDRPASDFKDYPLVPEGALVLINAHGTAPGSLILFDFAGRKKGILILPGPPDEMVPMFQTQARPLLEAHSRHRFIHRYVRLFGIGESRVEEQIRDLIENQGEVTIAPYASLKEVVVRVSQRVSREGGEDLTGPLVDLLKERFGAHVFEVGPRPLEQVLLDLLGDRKLTLALAESCTAGLAASVLGAVPGASRVLAGGLVTYSNEQKRRLLGLSYKMLERSGAVSCPTAVAMAENCLARTGAGAALSWTGFAGPDGGTREDPVGTVWIACAIRGKATEARRFHFPGSRERVRMRAAYTGFDMLRRLLLEP